MQVVTKRAEVLTRDAREEELYRERLRMAGLADFDVWFRVHTRCGSLVECQSMVRDCGACLAREVERRITQGGSHVVPRFRVSEVYVSVREADKKK